MLDMLIVTLFYFLPEAFLIAYTGLRLLGIKRPLKQVLVFTLAFGVCLPLVRSLPLPFGFHTVLLGILFVPFARLLFKLRVATSVTAYTLPLFVLSLGEQLFSVPLMNLMNTNPSAAMQSPWAHVLMGLVSALPLAVIALVAAKTDFVLVPAPEAESEIIMES